MTKARPSGSRVAHSEPDGAASRPRSERHVIAYLAYMGMLLAFGIDAALPAFDDLRSSFGLDEGSNRITLIVTLYFMGMAVGQLFYGPVADRFGRVTALRVGIGLYCVGAIGSIFAPSLGMLFLSRLVWGLGAAAPASLRGTIARDLYEGDQMARVIALMMGVFMAGPVVAPVMGELILALGSWEWIFVTALGLAAVLFAWTFQFGETLDPADRRPLDPRSTLQGFGIVFRTRVTLGYTLAVMFGYGAFIVFLGSSQPIIDNIYGRGDQFAIWFAVAGSVMAASFFGVNWFIKRMGAHRVALGVTALTGLTGGVMLVIALATDGVPPFALWLIPVILCSSLITLLTPTGYSLALEPMGSLAGTASGVVGFVTTAGGSGLAALVDANITTTVTPMALAYMAYSMLAIVCLVWAGAAAAAEDVGAPG